MVKHPTRKGPRILDCASETMPYRPAVWSSTPRICLSRSSPSGVVDRPWAWCRTNTWASSSDSICAIAAEMDDGDTCMQAAASAMLL
ncbi:Uncharacterised protein [Bordetella pertussis]|nr:Uncharacterised protein [Bordetella pertussis]CPM86374.1 Uncharacterised protein [Bordetella pertussis]